MSDEYGEIDHYVAQMRGETDILLPGQSDVDGIIEITTAEAMAWHEQINYRSLPLPHIPASDADITGMSLERNGAQASTRTETQANRGGLSCAELALIGAVVVGLLVFMMLAS